MRSAFVVVVATGLLLGAAPRLQACGHCKEDKIAATYDYSVVTAAKRKGQTVVFAELRGIRGSTAQLDSWIRQQAGATTGVVEGTVRVSLEPAALSFVCAPEAVSSTLRAIALKLARRGLAASLIEAQNPTRARVRSSMPARSRS